MSTTYRSFQVFSNVVNVDGRCDGIVCFFETHVYTMYTYLLVILLKLQTVIESLSINSFIDFFYLPWLHFH